MHEIFGGQIIVFNCSFMKETISFIGKIGLDLVAVHILYGEN